MKQPNKVQFKLDRRRLLIWLNFVNGIIVYGSFNSDTLAKMFVANLQELEDRLKDVSRNVKVKYTFSVSASQCLAFQYLIQTVVADVSSTDEVTLNEIAGIIDQKTK